jgi:hypothetical protein
MGVKAFAANGFTEETGFPVEYTTDDVTKLMEQCDLLKENWNAERDRRLWNYIDIYAGAHYLESVLCPFPINPKKPATMPLIKAAEVGKAIGLIQAAVAAASLEKLNARMSTPQITDRANVAKPFSSLEYITEFARRLKEELPDTKTATVVSYMSFSGSIKPELRRRVIAILDHAFGGSSPIARVFGEEAALRLH